LQYFTNSRCPQGSGENHTDMTISVRKRVGVAYNTNKSQILDKKQVPEIHNHLGKLCYLIKTK